MLDPIKATVPLKTRFLQSNSTAEEFFQTTMVYNDLLNPGQDGMTIPSRPGYILVYTCDADILSLLFNPYHVMESFECESGYSLANIVGLWNPRVLLCQTG